MKRHEIHFSRLILFPLLLALGSCQEPPEEEEVIRSVKAMKVGDPGLIRSRPFPGVTRAENRVNLSFRVDGPLIEFPVDVGDKVKEGQTLARIDPRDFEVALQNVQANLERSKARLAFAESDYDRAARIQAEDPGAISESMVDRKREDRNKLRAEVRSFEAEVEGAKDQLSYTHLNAPMDGMIVATYFDNFEFVRAKQAVVRLLDTSRVEMVVDIPEHLIAYVPSVTKVVVRLDTLPGKEIRATIKEIGTEASSITRTYPVTLVMKQPVGYEIFAGMSGEARFEAKIRPDHRKAEVLTIPTSSVFSDKESEKSYVWVIDEETMQVSRREIKLDRLSSTGVRVLEGVSSGEWIATAGVHSLREGQEVEILFDDEIKE